MSDLKNAKNEMPRLRRRSVLALSGAFLLPAAAWADAGLPAKFQNDPVAKALGPTIFNAALNEGKVTWYGATTTHDFLVAGGKQRFEQRFGVSIELINGQLRNLTDRLQTESAVGHLQGDVFLGNDEYMIELYNNNILEKWRPPAPELAHFNPSSFVQNPSGYWWPVQISAQALIINTTMVGPNEIKSYQDLLNPKWQGKIVMRDPRTLDGGGAQMLCIANDPALGIDYIKKLVAIAKPVIIQGGTDATKDAVSRGQFAIGFSGRGEFMRNLPADAPLKFIVPKEGLAWTPSSIAIIQNSPHQNAAKLLETWFYELAQLQLWASVARGVPDPNVHPPIPEMSVTAYPMMAPISEAQLGNLDPFFNQMEQIFGVR
jgi:iron(III) transport system substrate-binding protein